MTNRLHDTYVTSSIAAREECLKSAGESPAEVMVKATSGLAQWLHEGSDAGLPAVPGHHFSPGRAVLPGPGRAHRRAGADNHDVRRVGRAHQTPGWRPGHSRDHRRRSGRDVRVEFRSPPRAV